MLITSIAALQAAQRSSDYGGVASFDSRTRTLPARLISSLEYLGMAQAMASGELWLTPLALLGGRIRGSIAIPVRGSWHRATNQGARQQFKVSSCADIPMTVLDTADAAPGSASSWRMQWTIARVVVAAGRRDLNIRTLSLSSPRGGLTSLIQEFPLSWSR